MDLVADLPPKLVLSTVLDLPPRGEAIPDKISPSDVFLSLLQSDIGFGKLETYVKLDKLGEVSRL